MRNITVSVDEETHRLARIKAAELDTSVSALVREYLGRIATARGQERETVQDAATRQHVQRLHDDEIARVETPAGRPSRDAQDPPDEFLRQFDDLIADWDARGAGLRGFDRLTREEVHDRDRARIEMRLAVAEQRIEELARAAATAESKRSAKDAGPDKRGGIGA